GAVAGRYHRPQVQRGADAGARPVAGAHRLQGEPLAEELVVRGLQRGEYARAPRRDPPEAVSDPGLRRRLVQTEKVRHAVRERVVDDGGELGVALRRITDGPAALLLQRLGQIPVVDRDER